MKIAMTGATSFTGYWFAKELTEVGHEVHLLVHQDRTAYTGLRLERLKQLEKFASVHHSGPFGQPKFISALKNLNTFDLFCHHGADVTNYKSPDFDAVRALEKNTFNLATVLDLIKEKGCSELLLTGSVFEPKEGQGSDHLRAVSPYGLSKGLTTSFFDYWCQIKNVNLKKFIIPNPFGPFEEMRFTSFVAKTWLNQKIAPLTHPDYIRDNIPVDLLAKAYVNFATSSLLKINPSFYAGSQKEFTRLFQKEMQKRLSCPCEINILTQTDFSEPLSRINLDRLDVTQLKWDEEKSWDNLAEYYLKVFSHV